MDYNSIIYAQHKAVQSDTMLSAIHWVHSLTVLRFLCVLVFIVLNVHAPSIIVTW